MRFGTIHRYFHLGNLMENAYIFSHFFKFYRCISIILQTFEKFMHQDIGKILIIRFQSFGIIIHFIYILMK